MECPFTGKVSCILSRTVYGFRTPDRTRFKMEVKNRTARRRLVLDMGSKLLDVKGLSKYYRGANYYGPVPQ